MFSFPFSAFLLFQEHIKHGFDINHPLVSSKRGNLLFFLPKEEQTATAWACWRTNAPPDLSMKDMSPGETEPTQISAVPHGEQCRAVVLLSEGLTAMLPLNHFSSATSSSAISSPPGKAGRSPGQERCYEPRDTGGKEMLFTEMGMVFYHFLGF